MIEFEGITFRWLGHDGFLITSSSGKTVCIDPFQVEGDFGPVDILVSTHEHFDHCNIDDFKKFVSSTKTEVIGIPMARETLDKLDCKTVHYVSPSDEKTISSIAFEFVPAYNINKFREPGVPFHPKEDEKIGLVFEMDGQRIYHAGDTDNIPEIADFARIDIALLPVSGTYVMTAPEAIEAAKVLNPKLAIPMHFGAIVGDRSMAEEFEKGVSCKVEIPSLD
ncbi:MAG: MBL fold metallo-hydrolase [Candidatus Hodarchaeales archaeon]